jgi:hypothetical protein
MKPEDLLPRLQKPTDAMLTAQSTVNSKSW